MDDMITLSVPGTADTRIADGDLWREEPELAVRWKAQGKRRRVGRDYYSWVVALNREDWLRVGRHLACVEAATKAAADDNPGENEAERTELRAVRIVLARIEQYLPEVKQYRW